MLAIKSLVVIGLMFAGTGSLEVRQQYPLNMPVDDASYEDHCHGSFIPFDRFLKQVRLAKYEHYKHNKVRSQQAFNEMKAHILKMYEGVTKATSFVLQDEHADCIAIHEQPTVYHLGIKDIPQPPMNSTNDHKGDGTAPGNTTSAESPLKLGKKDRFRNPISCPKTSIPMARLSLEKLTQHPTLNDFFSKPVMDARPKRPGFSADEIHVHAYGIQYVQNFGGNSWLDLWNPTGDFTISQQWYQGYASDQPLQSLEGGWVSENSDNSRLFIYYTADGYGKLKCWNLDCPAFVQINHNWYLGGPWDHYSTKDGDQWGFGLQWKFYQGNWWLFLQGPGAYEAVGYYNQTIWNGGQMTHNASVIIYGGEVANYTGGENFPQMGSGDLAEKGWQEAAFQKTIFWIPKDENDGVGVWANLTVNDEGKSSCYTIDLVNWPNGGDWGTYFYFGGPGGNDCPL